MSVESPRSTERAPAVVQVERALAAAAERGASDVHLEPTAAGYELRYRIDGLLQPGEPIDADQGRAMVSRLMVLAGLLTYRRDVPQEGRMTMAIPANAAALSMRVAVMPTTHGLRAVVRMPAELTQPRELAGLGLPAAAERSLRRFAGRDAGLLLLTGPAGSGKTTTIYALLEHVIATQPGLSIVTLEEPVERDLVGVTQVQVEPFGAMTYERALPSVLRQDPQVLMIGEIRTAATASLAVQAALSGHRTISTLHAGSAAGAIARLLEMGIEPYQITSALFGVVNQRLVRTSNPDAVGGTIDARANARGYAGRAPVAEVAEMGGDLRQAILERADLDRLASVIAARPAHQSLRDSAEALLATGRTDEAELRRVLGGAGRAVDEPGVGSGPDPEGTHGDGGAS